MNENIFTKMITTLFGGKVRRAIRQAEKIFKDDPALQSQLKDAAKKNKDVSKALANYCKRNPNSEHCKDGKWISGKSKLGVEGRDF